MSLLIGVVGVVASVVSIYLFAEDLRSRRRFGWKHVEKLVKELIAEMDRHGYVPDLILGVGRGGAILAGMLAGNLGHLPLAVIDTILDRSSGASTATIRYPECCPSLEDKSVLVVVGELYSGEDLREGIKFVTERNPREIKTATLLTHQAASVRPDFVGMQTDKPLSAPWRISDQYRRKRL